jgi:hypothetical protein
MSINLNNLAVTEFDTLVKHLYQAEGANLTSYVRARRINGATAQFPVFGRSLAHEHIPGSPIPLQNPTRQAVTVTSRDWVVQEASNVFMQAKVNFDEVGEISKSIVMSIKRRVDQLVIDALNASTTSLLVANDISGTPRDLTVDAIRQAAFLLSKENVPMEGRTLLIHASGLKSLLGDDKATSADFVNVKALMTGEVNTFMGFRVVTLGDIAEGGLPKTGSNRTCFAFHQQALGAVASMDLSTRVDFDTRLASYVATAMYSGNAVAIDNSGIVKITTQEA